MAGEPPEREPPPGAVLVDDDGEVIGELRRPPARSASAGPRDAPLAPGDVVGRYVVERPLAEGGMGVVSLARDPELHRQVVIKLVHPSMGASMGGSMGGEGGDEFEARLRREAQAMAQVSHSNVVQIFDIGRRGERVFLAMEFIAGQTLGEWLRERPRSPDEILGAICQAGAGLAAAHRAGLIHRDFKPSNVLVGRDGAVKVTDFGLARSAAVSDAAAAGAAGATRQIRAAARGRQPSPPSPASPPSGVHAVLTQANAVLGTPAYMAPEQAAGQAIDARTDQYALALTLLDALLGQPPNRRVVAPDAPPAIDAALRVSRIAAPVRAAIIRALASDPAGRFATVDDFLRALAPPAGGGPAPRSRRALVAVIGGALCAAAAAAWFAVGRAPAPVRPEPVRAPPACTAEAPARWTGAPRARALAALSTAPRPFAGWDAERIALAVDAAVDALAADEVARCRAAPVGPADAPLGSSPRDAAARAGATPAGSAPRDATAGAGATPAGSAPRDGPLGSSTRDAAARAGATPAGSAPRDAPAGAGVPPVGGDAGGDCLARRGAALGAAVTALSAAPPPGDPWPVVRAIARCDLAGGPDTAALRGELASAGVARARAIAAIARRAGEQRRAADPGDALAAAGLAALAADALEAAGAAALAGGDASAATGDFEELAAAGERSGDDAVRGRALLHLIAAAQWRGSHAEARRDLDQLAAILTRHGDQPRDALAAALVAGDAFTDLGDVAAAFAARDRAAAAAAALGDPDAVLAAAIGRAWSMHALRFDLAGARAAATAALAAAGAAGPAARSRALAIAAELALVAGDAAAAGAALNEAARVDPGQAGLDGQSAPDAQSGKAGQAGQSVPDGQSGKAGQAGQAGLDGQSGKAGQAGQAVPDGQSGKAGQAGQSVPGAQSGKAGQSVPGAQSGKAGPAGPIAQIVPAVPAGLVAHRLRSDRTAALAGELDAALAELARLTATAAGDELAAVRIVAARGQILLAADHAAEAADVLDGLGPARRGEPGRGARLPAAEQLEIALAAYEAHLIAPGARKPVRPALLDALHPRAPVRARFELLDAAHTPAEQPAGRAFALDTALRLLLEAGAAPVAIAAVRWQRAQLRLAGSDYRGLAATAREAFQAAGRTAEVTEIDRWLASLPAP